MTTVDTLEEGKSSAINGDMDVVSAPNPANLHLETTESKQDMTVALTSLISTFSDESQRQDELLTSFETEAMANSRFGDQTRAQQWTVNEVCYWLSSQGLQDYVNAFHAAGIDGAILLRDMSMELLRNELGVNSIHCNKIMRHIEPLKQASAAAALKKKNDEPELHEMMQQIKAENEELLTALKRQSAFKAVQTSQQQQTMHTTTTCMDGLITNKNGGGTSNSLHDMVSSQNETIEELTDKLAVLQNQTHRKIKELEKKNQQLQDGYIQIETHYQSQLQDSRMQSKQLQQQIATATATAAAAASAAELQFELKKKASANGYGGGGGGDGHISLLWAENENDARELAAEKERRIMLEAKLKSVQLALSRESQKRKLLESQTSRLTAELTKYLQPTPIARQTEKVSKFPALKRNKSKAKKINSPRSASASSPPSSVRINSGGGAVEEGVTATRRKPSMEAKAGWLRFLASANRGAQSQHQQPPSQSEQSEARKPRSMSFNLHKPASLTNLQQRLQKKKSKKEVTTDTTTSTMTATTTTDLTLQSVDETTDVNGVDGDKLEQDGDADHDSYARNNDIKHVRKSTLGQTMMATLKKIQNAAHQKMDERAIRKQQQKQDGDGADMQFQAVSATDIVGNGNADDAAPHVPDEDSSAEQAELEYGHQVIVTAPAENMDDEEEEEDEDSGDLSLVNKENEDMYSNTGIELEFAPSLEALPQTVELDILERTDTDASV